MAVVVVSHNSEADLDGCLQALIDGGGCGPIVVVDNASSDGSVARARAWDQVTVLKLDRNTGFAGGCNRGFAAVRKQAETIAFMNPDVRVRPGWFSACREVFRSRPEAGSVAPLLLRPDGRTVDSAGQVLKPGVLEVRDRGFGSEETDSLLAARPVLAACGALAVFRREALESVVESGGPWPAHYFCFWEDLELGWRLNNRGWQVWFEPEIRAVHGRGAGAEAGTGPLRWRRPPALEACVLSNRWMTLIRHVHALDLAWRAPVLLAWDFVLVGAGVSRRPSVLRHLLKRWPLVRAELRRRGSRPRMRLADLPC